MTFVSLISLIPSSKKNYKAVQFSICNPFTHKEC